MYTQDRMATQILKLKSSLRLATYARGNEKAQKLALVLPGRLDTKDYTHMISHVDYLADPHALY
jgi:hypothetical protein